MTIVAVWKPNGTRCRQIDSCVIDLNDGWCATCSGYVEAPRPPAVFGWGDAEPWPQAEAVRRRCQRCARRRLTVYGAPGHVGQPALLCAECWWEGAIQPETPCGR